MGCRRNGDRADVHPRSLVLHQRHPGYCRKHIRNLCDGPNVAIFLCASRYRPLGYSPRCGRPSQVHGIPNIPNNHGHHIVEIPSRPGTSDSHRGCHRHSSEYHRSLVVHQELDPVRRSYWSGGYTSSNRLLWRSTHSPKSTWTQPY